MARTAAWSFGASTSTPMCTGPRGSSKLPRSGCTDSVGANGQPPGDVLAPKQRASTLRSVKGWFGSASSPCDVVDPPPSVVAGGVEVDVGVVVGVGSVLAGGGVLAVWAERWCFRPAWAGSHFTLPAGFAAP